MEFMKKKINDNENVNTGADLGAGGIKGVERAFVWTPLLSEI